MFGLLEGQGGLSGPLAAILGGEPDGFAFDFTTMYGELRDSGVKTVLSASDLTYSSPGTKWVRNRSGVYESGTALRTEFDKNGSALGTLLELSKTNVVRYSQDISNTGWSTTNASVDHAGPDMPDASGGVCWRLVPDTSNASHILAASTTTSATAGQASVWYAIVHYDGSPGEYRYVHMAVNAGAYGASVRYGFDLELGTSQAVVTGTNSGALIKEVLPGWWRICVYADATASAAATGYIYAAASLLAADHAGDGTSGVPIYHAQFTHLTSKPSSPIKTSGAAATRAADIVTKALSNFTSYVDGGPGTLVVCIEDSEHSASTAVGRVASLWVDANNRVEVLSSDANSTLTVRVQAGGTVQNTLTPAALSQPGTFAVAWNTNDLEFLGDASSPVTDTSLVVPTGLTTLSIGSFSSVYQLGGHIRWIAWVPRRMSSAELAKKVTLR